MAATLVTRQGGPFKLNRGTPVNLGTLTSVANQAVQFSISEPTRDHQGVLIIQIASGITVGTGAFGLEISLDGGVSWFDIALTAITTADFTDTAATSGFQVTVSGMGGASFRFGIKTLGTMTGSAAVWALVG